MHAQVCDYLKPTHNYTAVLNFWSKKLLRPLKEFCAVSVPIIDPKTHTHYMSSFIKAIGVRPLVNTPPTLYDNGPDADERVIVFETEVHLQQLASCDTLCMDATFVVAPRLFHQLYDRNDIQ